MPEIVKHQGIFYIFDLEIVVEGDPPQTFVYTENGEDHKLFISINGKNTIVDASAKTLKAAKELAKRSIKLYF